MLNTIVVIGLVLAVVGKLVGVAFMMRSEGKATRVPFIVLVTIGYVMIVGGGLAGGSASF